ncbi:hypothetical protein F2Q68_00004732 [Brassica cretica]|uniref:Uncharacterized protein n=1 Tax=Brassica cretica TaxID=69181 RepID=A0A8S9JHK5_BRACR|nr:hypothetical protein F2Q68_00004732 [Brassica cretica]
MANRRTGDDGRGRIWGEGMDWTGGGLGYRSDHEDGNGISEMFGHDRSPLQRTRSFPIYGNRTRVREDSLASIGPSRNWDRRHQHDQSIQSHPRPDQNRSTEGPEDQGAENTLKLLHDRQNQQITELNHRSLFSSSAISVCSSNLTRVTLSTKLSSWLREIDRERIELLITIVRERFEWIDEED